ncbi:hypothetical protein OTC26_028565 [Streptomyces tirandamycinicus]|uniref:hypothetical protein n=1 Tax=Streptomyces tirandamycinicus TaxID=2174846 RepID=UPI00226E7168|nr:hypothetical protein [Streptomyces tirandamycinicus]MCY0985046.1 hypothetical protein [Streptomyces tirandamycinicus]
MDLMSLAKRPLRATRAGVVAGLATVALLTTAGTAVAAPAPHGDDAAVPIGSGAPQLSEGLLPAALVTEIVCRQLESAARGGVVPEEALALCKHVNGWD